MAEALVVAHLSLIEPIARRLALRVPKSFTLEDLIGAGRLGLVEAARRFAPESHGGAVFEAYARRRIRGAMLDCVRRAAWRDAKTTRTAGLDRWVAPLSESDVDKAALALRMSAAIRALPDRQRSVLLMHYEDGLKFRAVGRALRVNHQRASAIHMQAIRSLRRRLCS